MLELPPSSDRETLSETLREALRARLGTQLELPLLPHAAARVLAVCQDERADMRKLALEVQHDPSFSAHVLRVANSVAYAASSPILSLQQAIGRIGLSTLRDVVVAVTLKQRVFSVSEHQDRIRALWRHSAATACYAKEIAHLLRRDVDSPFLCGLLHDVGMPAVLQIVSDLEREKVVGPVSADEAEAAMLEFHSELGVRIAKAWQLGPWVSLVIRHHHAPEKTRFHPSEVPIVSLADQLAHWALDADKQEQDFCGDASLIAALRLQDWGLVSLIGKRARVLEAIEAFS